MSKRQTQWVGGAKSMEPKTDASTTTSDIIEMIPAVQATAVAGARTKFVIEAIYLKFSIRRELITTFDALGFLVWVANVQEGGNVPVQALNALSLESRFYGNKNIMMMAPLPVPPVFFAGDLLTGLVDEAIITDTHEFQASRKLDSSNQVLAMTINSDVSVVCNVFAQWRILLSYGT